jgi:hypothetical protein
MAEQDTRRSSPLKVGQRVKCVGELTVTEYGSTAEGQTVPHGCVGEVTRIDGEFIDVRFSFYHNGVVASGVATNCGRGSLETVLGKPRMIGEARPGSEGETKEAPKQGRTYWRRSRTELSEYERSQIGALCPKCGKGHLREKYGKHGPFVSCDQYHITGCTYVVRESQQQQESGEQDESGEQRETEQRHEMEPESDTEPVPGTLDAMVVAIVRKYGATNAAQVRGIVSDALNAWGEKFKPGDREIVVTVKDAAPVTVKGKAHARLKDVLAAIAACDPTGEETGTVSYPNVMLVGPAGSGKTTLAGQVAECLQLPWDGVSCHPEMPASKIEGRMLVKLMTGEEVYIPTGFVAVVRDGGVWINDEGDNMNGGLSIVYNAVLANGWMTLPNGERINRHRHCIFIHCANTYGTGADPIYVREQQDAAFLDRFVGMKFFVDYDPELEQSLCPEVEIREAVYKVRRRVADLGLKGCIIGTRALVTARRIVTREGRTLDEALRRITDGWSKHNRQSCGVPLAA